MNDGEAGPAARGGGIYCADSDLLLEYVTVGQNAANGDIGGNGTVDAQGPGWLSAATVAMVWVAEGATTPLGYYHSARLTCPTYP